MRFARLLKNVVIVDSRRRGYAKMFNIAGVRSVLIKIGSLRAKFHVIRACFILTARRRPARAAPRAAGARAAPGPMEAYDVGGYLGRGGFASVFRASERATGRAVALKLVDLGRMARAGVGARHSQCFAAWYAHCPGLKARPPLAPSVGRPSRGRWGGAGGWGLRSLNPES